jgi:hypothetical protein
VTTPRNDAPWAADPPDRRSLQEEMAIQIERGRPDGAAFLDGLSDEELADFALALEVQAELEAQDATAAEPGVHTVPEIHDEAAESATDAAAEPGVIPLRRPERRPRRLSAQWMALAAVLAGVMLVPFAWRASRGGAVEYPSQAVAMLENPAAGLPVDYDSSRPWSRTRGASGPSTDERRAVQFGAYMVDLELAVRARDAEETRLMARRAELLMQDVTAGGLVATSLQAVTAQAGGEPSAVLPDLDEANETAANLLDAEWLVLGAWGEAARFAAARQDTEFFRSPRTRRTLDRAEALVEDHQGSLDALGGIRGAVGGDPVDWTALRIAVDALLKAIA